MIVLDSHRLVPTLVAEVAAWGAHHPRCRLGISLPQASCSLKTTLVAKCAKFIAIGVPLRLHKHDRLASFAVYLYKSYMPFFNNKTSKSTTLHRHVKI